MNKYQLVLSVSLLSSVAIVQAHDGTEHDACSDMSVSSSIKQYDINKDGVVTLDEYLATAKINATKMFKHIDANGDGKLDAAEQKDIDDVMRIMHGAPATTMDKKNISM